MGIIYGGSGGIDFEDANLKASLLPYYDADDDGDISESEAEKYVYSLNLSGAEIYSLSGLEYFTNFVILNISDNDITSYDSSSHYNLTEIYIYGSELTEVSITNSAKLNVCTITNAPNLSEITLKNCNASWPYLDLNLSNNNFSDIANIKFTTTNILTGLKITLSNNNSIYGEVPSGLYGSTITFAGITYRYSYTTLSDYKTVYYRDGGSTSGIWYPGEPTVGNHGWYDTTGSYDIESF